MSYKYYYKKSKTKLVSARLVPPEPIIVTVIGGGFDTRVISFTAESQDAIITGGGFGSVFSSFGGSDIDGGSFLTSFSSSVQANNEALVIGRGFATEFVIAGQGIIDVNAVGGGFSTEFSAYDAARVKGGAFNSSLLSAVEASDLVSIVGNGFTQSVIIVGVGNESANITGRGFSSSLFYNNVIGGGFDTRPIIAVINDVSRGGSFVMNIHTNEVSRYTNYDFLHIIHVGNKSYGVKSDGLYFLGGDLDIDQAINGTIELKETDFGIYQSKNVPSVYINSDESTDITSFIDGIIGGTYTSQFSGRKTKLSRKSRGRYWKLKIEKIKQLDGVEILPQKLQRRVK